MSKMSGESKKKPDHADVEADERQKAAESDLQTMLNGILNLMQMQILDRDTRDHQFEDKLEKQRDKQLRWQRLRTRKIRLHYERGDTSTTRIEDRSPR